MRRIALLVAILCAGITLAAVVRAADSPADRCREAAAAIDTGHPEQALDLLESAVAGIWAKLPLTLRHTTLISGPPEGYGTYQPRSDNAYAPGESIYLYTEPVGYTVELKDGVYSFALAADFNLLDAQGTVLGGQRDFGSWKIASRRFNSQFEIHLNFDFSGLEPGNYVVEVTVRDLNSTKSAVHKQPLVIR